jgi:hypothetical protein
MHKKLLLTAFGLMLIFAVNAQSMGYSYKTAIGVKVWDGGGLSIKHFIKPSAALEGILYFWDKGFRVTGLYEYHGEINGAQGLKWYVGGGAHLGFYDYKNDPYYNNNSQTFIGIDGVLGLDYKFNKAPINISLDWQPSFEFGNNRGFVGSWGGLGIRYAFGK